MRNKDIENEMIEDESWDDEDSANPPFVNRKKNKSKVKQHSYEAFYMEKLPEGEKPLANVIGHDKQKEEILRLVDWFKNSKALKAKGVSIPRGLIMFGSPGNGKSMLIKEIIRCVEAPVFVFRGEDTNIVGGIVEVFREAKKAGHAVVVFDELDLLINKDKRVVRALQESLDGVESSDDIFVLAATNSLRDIPDPLLRNGRLEKIIRIPYPTGEEAVTLLKKHFKEFGVDLPKDFDEEETALLFTDISCAGVKAVVNDVVLRNGFENITNEMIDSSIYYISEKVKDKPKEDNIEVAIHEAAHAVVANSFPQFFKMNRITIAGASGVFYAEEKDEGFWPYDKVVADIKISMAGNIAQKLFCGRGSRGAESDLQRARSSAYNIFTQNGYSSCWETLPPVEQGRRIETQEKRRRMEKKIEKFLRKCEKETRSYLAKNEKKVRDLGKLLFEKKHLKPTEILSVIG